MDNILHSSLSIFHSFLLWVCGLGIAAIALAYVGYLLARFPGKVRRSIRTYGLPTVIALAALMVFATIEGTPTNEDKERYQQQHQQQGGLPDPGQDGSVPGDSGTGSDSDADGLPGIMTLELGDDDYGTDGSDGATEGAGTIEAELLTLPDIRPLTESDYAAGIVLSQIGTDETHSFEPILGAEICDDWRRFGAATDWFRCKWRMENEEWRMVLGTNVFDAVTVFSYGTVRPSMTNLTTFVSPFQANIGIVPESNWPLLIPTTNDDDILHSPFSILHSQFWQALTPSNTFVMCWQNVPWNRDVHYPFSFMIEFEEKGDITFRYDLANVKWRMENGEWVENAVLSNVCVGVMNNGLGRAFNALPTNVTSLKFAHLDPTRADDFDPDGDGLTTEDEVLVHHTDPYDADTDKDGLSDGREVNETHTDPLDPHSLDPRYPDGVAVVLGDLDPFDSPDGSTHTYLEHVFYTGTTNAPFAYPQSTDDTAVLRVSVSGTGSGELVVGDKVVPLLSRESPAHNAPRRARSTGGELTPPPNALLVTVVKGCDVRIYLRGDPSLALDLDSEDFAFGRLPNSAGTSASSYFVNFPNTKAETPCIHDFNARKKRISLSATSGASGLTAEWSGPSDVEIENLPPRSAEITARFSARESSGISYEVDHPLYLFGRKHYDQTVRFCPRPSEEDDEDEDPDWYESGEGDPSDGDSERDEHWCCYWGVCEEWCDCGCECWNDDEVDDDSPDEDEDFDDDCPVHAVSYEDCAHLHEETYTNSVATASPLGGVLYVREPLLFEQIHLDAPTGICNCCSCPDHHTNYVGVAYKSYRLKLLDADGTDFIRTTTSCDVNLAGVYPSSSVGDAPLAFARNGEVYRRYNKTVLGVGIRGESGVDLPVCNALDRRFGYPMTVCTNVWEAPSLSLVTNVKLPSGNVHLELADATGQFTVWYLDRRTWEYRKLLDTATTPVKNLSMSYWKALMRRSTYGDSSEMPIQITSASPGGVTLRFRYWTVVDGKFVQDEAVQRITSVPPPIRLDITRDASIDNGDAAAWLSGRTFYYWTNQDTNKGDYIGAVDDYTPNARDLVVNGTFDLVNFFPATLDFKPFKDAWGDHVTYVVKPQWAETNSFNFCFADVPWSQAGSIQTTNTVTLTGQPLSYAQLAELPAGGVELPLELLTRFSEDSGLMICEAKRPYVSLRCEIRVDGSLLYSYSVPMTILPVKEMYSWYNFRNVSGDAIVRPSAFHALWEEQNTKSLVFLHGANVDEEHAEAWGDAVFKRTWLAGCKADFYNVDWRSNIGSPANYHENASNAFVVASQIVSSIRAIPGEKVIMAHSLGNMVVSSMIQDHGLQVSRYLMCDSAVPSEAYYPEGTLSIRVPQLVHPDWENYPTNSWTSNWHTLFANDANDDRKYLGWPGRFIDVAQYAVNFYSTGDEVLELRHNNNIHLLVGATSGYVQYSWHHQELWKGRGNHEVLGATTWSGWNIEENWLGANKISEEEARLIDDRDPTEFKTNTVFYCYPTSMNSTNISLLVRAAHLTHGIPSLARATGARDLYQAIGNQDNFDLNEEDAELATSDGDDEEAENEHSALQTHCGVSKPNGWPVRSKWDTRWLHSDMKDVSYFYNFMFYNKVIEKGGLR